MTLRYYKPGDYWFRVETGEIEGRPGKVHNPEAKKLSHTNTIIRDLPDHKSPIDGTVISGRRQRREYLKRNNLREVDNTEHKPVYRNPEFYLKRGISPDRCGEPLPRTVHTGYDATPDGARRLFRE